MAFRFHLQEPACDVDFLSLVDGETLFNSRDANIEPVKQGTIRQLGWHPIRLPAEWFLSTQAHTSTGRVMEVLQCAIQYLQHELDSSNRKKTKSLALAKEFADERDAAFEELVELRESEAMLRKRLLIKGTGQGEGERPELRAMGRLSCTLCGNSYPTTNALHSHYMKRHKRTEEYAACAATFAAVSAKQAAHADTPVVHMTAAADGGDCSNRDACARAPGAPCSIATAHGPSGRPTEPSADTRRETLALRSELLDVRLALAKLVEENRFRHESTSALCTLAMCGALPGLPPDPRGGPPSVPLAAAATSPVSDPQRLRWGETSDRAAADIASSLAEATRRIALLEGVVAAQASALASGPASVPAAQPSGVGPGALSTHALAHADVDLAVSPMTQVSPSVHHAAAPAEPPRGVLLPPAPAAVPAAADTQGPQWTGPTRAAGAVANPNRTATTATSERSSTRVDLSPLHSWMEALSSSGARTPPREETEAPVVPVDGPPQAVTAGDEAPVPPSVKPSRRRRRRTISTSLGGEAAPAAAAPSPANLPEQGRASVAVPGSPTAAAGSGQRNRGTAATLAAAVMKKPRQWMSRLTRKSKNDDRKTEGGGVAPPKPDRSPTTRHADLHSAPPAPGDGVAAKDTALPRRRRSHQDPAHAQVGAAESTVSHPPPAPVEERPDRSRDASKDNSAIRSIPTLRLVSEEPSPAPTLPAGGRGSRDEDGLAAAVQGGYAYPGASGLLPDMFREVAATPTRGAWPESLQHDEEDVVNLASSSPMGSASLATLELDEGVFSTPVDGSGRGGRRSLAQALAATTAALPSPYATPPQVVHVPHSGGPHTPPPPPLSVLTQESSTPLGMGRAAPYDSQRLTSAAGDREKAHANAPVRAWSGGVAAPSRDAASSSSSYEYYYSSTASEEKAGAAVEDASGTVERVPHSAPSQGVPTPVGSRLAGGAGAVKPPVLPPHGTRPVASASGQQPISKPLIIRRGPPLGSAGKAAGSKAVTPAVSAQGTAPSRGDGKGIGKDTAAPAAAHKGSAESPYSYDDEDGSYYSYSYTPSDEAAAPRPRARHAPNTDGSASDSYSYYYSYSSPPDTAREVSGHAKGSRPSQQDPLPARRGERQRSRHMSDAVSAPREAPAPAQSDAKDARLVGASKRMVKKLFGGLGRKK